MIAEEVMIWHEWCPVANAWVVLSATENGPVTEACDDWFANEQDAIDVVKRLESELC